MKRLLAIFGSVLVCSLIVVGTALPAVITAEQRKELTQIREDVADVEKLFKDKKYDEAGKALDESASVLCVARR